MPSISHTPVQSGDALVADVENYQVGPRQIAVWWLGQHSFIVKAGPTILYIDPFLTPMAGRLVPPLLTPQQLAHAHIVCGSHDHADHIDRPVWPAIAQAAPQAKFVVPDLLRDGLSRDLDLAPERLVGLDEGLSVELAGVKITALASAHEFLDRDPATGKYPYLGFVFEANGCTWYHSGDTVWYEGLQTKLRRWSFDLMLLPINGRDAKRLSTGIIGNMTYQEAADLSGPLAPALVVPTHFEMFAGNPGDPFAFEEYMQVKYPTVPTRICRHGERFICEARPRT